jgi:hypothetical protein
MNCIRLDGVGRRGAKYHASMTYQIAQLRRDLSNSSILEAILVDL